LLEAEAIKKSEDTKEVNQKQLNDEGDIYITMAKGKRTKMQTIYPCFLVQQKLLTLPELVFTPAF
jgi:hypothetical protein